jgi:hypothetical protein
MTPAACYFSATKAHCRQSQPSPEFRRTSGRGSDEPKEQVASSPPKVRGGIPVVARESHHLMYRNVGSSHASRRLSAVQVPVGTAFTGPPDRSVRARLRIGLLRRMGTVRQLTNSFTGIARSIDAHAVSKRGLRHVPSLLEQGSSRQERGGASSSCTSSFE